VSATRSVSAVAVLDLGADVPVHVYLGGPGSATSVGFARVAGHPGLASARRHVLVDLIGSGWSDHDDAFGYTIDEHAGTVSSLGPDVVGWRRQGPDDLGSKPRSSVICSAMRATAGVAVPSNRFRASCCALDVLATDEPT
jgi:hypothetical protein